MRARIDGLFVLPEHRAWVVQRLPQSLGTPPMGAIDRRILLAASAMIGAGHGLTAATDSRLSLIDSNGLTIVDTDEVPRAPAISVGHPVATNYPISVWIEVSWKADLPGTMSPLR